MSKIKSLKTETLKIEISEIIYVTPKNQLWSISIAGLKKCIKKSFESVKNLPNFFEKKNFISYKDSLKIKNGRKLNVLVNGLDVVLENKKIHIKFLNKQNIIKSDIILKDSTKKDLVVDKDCFQGQNDFLSTNVNKICVMDCIKGLKKIPNESVSIIICDPPYNIGKDFGNKSDKQSLATYLRWCKLWIKECLRILRKDGSLYIYGFSEILAHIQVICLKNIHIRWLIWHYTNKVSPKSQFWQRSHESILCCSKVKNPNFNRDLVREPYTASYEKLNGKLRKNTSGRFGNKTTVYNVNDLGALPRDVIKIPALSGSFGKKERVLHPTQKPLALCEKLIKATLSTDNLLIVPFAGSGSECVASKNLNVPFVGFEINKNYAVLAKSRLE